MDRRWAGVVIVIVTVLSAVVAPSIAGRRIAGAPLVAPVPGPPDVGDCLTVPPGGGGFERVRPSYEPQALAPCQAARFGEVVAVIRDGRSHQPAVPTIQAPADGSTLTDDPNQLACSDAASRYVGLGVAADHSPLVSAYWSPLAFLGTTPSGPTARQKSAGQTWVACVLMVYDDAQSGLAVAYPGTLKDTYKLGTEPASFALCLDSPALDSTVAVRCGEPHAVEAFGRTGTATVGLTQSSLDATCRALVGKLTGMVFPLAGGQLRAMAPAVHGFATQEAGLGKPDDQSGFAACLVVATGKRQLGGTLLALGAKPVPWVP